VKFLDRLRRVKEVSTARPQEPRLIGEAEPQYSVSAEEAFIDVLTKGSVAYQPFLTVDSADPVRDLDRAVQTALLHCNRELQARMLTFRDAAIARSRGGGSEEEVNAALEHFTLGCRLALGTND
jgi:hypothetical protein